jgi:hypothetical protein
LYCSAQVDDEDQSASSDSEVEATAASAQLATAIPVACEFPLFSSLAARVASFRAADAPLQRLPGIQAMAEANLFWPPNDVRADCLNPVCFLCGTEVLGMHYGCEPSAMHWCRPRSRKRSAKAAAAATSALSDGADEADDSTESAARARKRRKAPSTTWCDCPLCRWVTADPDFAMPMSFQNTAGHPGVMYGQAVRNTPSLVLVCLVVVLPRPFSRVVIARRLTTFITP